MHPTPHSLSRAAARPPSCLVALVVLLAGCVGSAPPRLYTLDLDSPGGVAGEFNVEFARLRPDAHLARNELLLRKGPSEVDYYRLDQWAGNVGDLVARKLNSAFGTGEAGRPSIAVSGQVLRFEMEQQTDSAVRAVARLALEFRRKGSSPYEEPLLKKMYDAVEPLDTAAPSALAMGLSRCVDRIALAVADDLRNLQTAHEGPERPKTRMVALDMRRSGKASTSVNIDVMPLRRHEALARNTIVIRSAPTRIEHYPADRWAANVSSLVAEKLESEFGPPKPDRETVQVSGEVLAFERVDTPGGTQAHVKLDVTMQTSGAQGGPKPILWKLYDEYAPAEDDTAQALAEALSEILARIAVNMAEDAGRIPPPSPDQSAPSMRLYTLDMTPTGRIQPKFNVVFEKLLTHDSLAHANILVVRDKTVVDYYPNDRWASGLAVLVPEKLAAELGSPREDRPTLIATGRITGFEETEDHNQRSVEAKVNLSFRWAGRTADAPVLQRIYEAKFPLETPGAEATVRALSKALEDIAGQISADLDLIAPPNP
ncbi:MAG: hypothetical protein AMXMBFR4_14060 [Candidatus Hydrogenedentota bacterium]